MRYTTSPERRRVAAVVSSLIAISFAVSCGSVGQNSGFSGGGNGNGDNGGGGGGGSLDGSFGGDDATCDTEGCTCPNPGATQACWTGPADQRNVGACHDGKETCTRNGEVAVWGPCEGEELNCGNGDGGGGTEDAGDCQCVPGTRIWCDEDCTDNIYCSFHARRDCQPNGTFGPCHEVNSQPTSTNECKQVGLGCASCNKGKGVYFGDCTQQLKCVNWTQPNCTSYSSQNGVVTCNCK
jgi:hypothetical protein